MFDQNEDGNVDAIEFALLLSVIVRGSEEEKLNCNSNLFKLKILNYFFFKKKVMFRLIDRDHNGKITKEELVIVFEIYILY